MRARTGPLALHPAAIVPPPPAAAGTVPSAGQAVTPWLMVVLAVILFSGGLFGYDQGVISGALHGIKATFSLSALLVEVVTSWVTLGALFGALAGGELADRIGRKPTVLIAGAMFTLGALVQALAPDTVILVAGRLIVGAGVGVAAVAAPLYAAELAPTRLRGRDLRQGKPSPEIFLLAAAGLHVAPEHCLFVEDASAGVLAARAGHMGSLGMARHSDMELLRAAAADHVVASLDDVAMDDLSNGSLSRRST